MQAERKGNFGTWLRGAWDAAIRTMEAMDRSPVEELFDRIDRLEREMGALRKESAAESHAAIAEMAKYATKAGMMLTVQPQE